MTHISTYFYENLHAKCYLNENKALLTLMNLYDFSQVHNLEMGLVVSRETEGELYGNILEESDRLIKFSKAQRVKIAVTSTVANTTKPSGAAKRTRSSTVIPTYGFCIRCKKVVPANPTQPYCDRCCTSWKRFENKSYEEKHCHICGSEFASTLLKPLCLACYRKYKDVLEFATA